jgi:hypothetical protein
MNSRRRIAGHVPMLSDVEGEIVENIWHNADQMANFVTSVAEKGREATSIPHA